MASKPTTQQRTAAPVEKVDKGVGGLRELAEVIFYGISLLLFFKGYCFQNFQIPTSSMENTLLIGDHITANNFIFKSSNAFEKAIFPFRDVKRGDILVFKWPGDPKQDWVKRCIGVPGDRYSLRDDELTLNGQKMNEGYAFYKSLSDEGSTRCADLAFRPCDYYSLKPSLDTADFRMHDSAELAGIVDHTRDILRANMRKFSRESGESLLARLDSAIVGDEIVIPDGYYLMMGDNRNNSYDSRKWGLVPIELVQGKAYFVWWSYGEDEGSHQLTGFDLVWSYLRVPIEFFRRTHWDKTFTLIK